MNNKSKTESILLIIILFIALNYGVYSYYLTTQYKKIEAQQTLYQKRKNYLNELKNSQKNLVNLKTKSKTLKTQASELNNLIIYQLDTPKLVYDFYTSCSKYKIKGISVTFNLNKQHNTNNTNLTTPDIFNNQNTSINTTDKNINKKNFGNVSLVKLSITLKVIGKKTNVEKFIKNLKKITTINLSVKSISLKTNFKNISNNSSQNNINTKNKILPNTSNQVTPSDKTPTIINTNEMNSEIVFYQYLLLNGKQYNELKKYDFFNGANGFKSLSDMMQPPTY